MRQIYKIIVRVTNISNVLPMHL